MITSTYPYTLSFSYLFFFTYTATTEIYTLSLHDALPILTVIQGHTDLLKMSAALPAAITDSIREISLANGIGNRRRQRSAHRSEEHTSELQSQSNLVCRLLLEKKKTKNSNIPYHQLQTHI